MTVSESPASPHSSMSPQHRDNPSKTAVQAPRYKGQSQRADSLGDMLSLDRLISEGIREDWASRFSQGNTESAKNKMLNQARLVIEITRQSW